MENKVLSIEIGEYKTKICVLNNKKKHPRVYHTLVFDTPSRCIEDGIIQEKDILAEVIFGKLRERNINVTDVIFTISSSKIATHEVVIPLVKNKDIQEFINAGASDYFPINVSEYVISYIILEKVQTKQCKNIRLLAIATHNNLLTSYFELAKILKLNIVSIDYLSNSILQIIQKQINHKGTSMFVQINEKNTLINIMNNGVLELHRTIAYGTGAVVDAVMDSPIDQVENEANAMQPLINNIIRVIEYYYSKNRENPVQTIYLTGIGAKLNGIEELFRNEIGIHIKFLNELSGINFKETVLPENYLQSDFLDCIGATFAPMGIVPKQYSEKVEKKSMMKEVIEISALDIVTSIVLAVVSITSV